MPNKHISFIILLAVSLLFIGCTKQVSESDTHGTANFEVSPELLNDKIQNKENFILLDVRENYEYEEEHIENVANPTLLLSVNEINAETLADIGLKKDDEIIVYCRSGKRSAAAHNAMIELGYTNVKSLAGGIVHWKEDNFPVKNGEYNGNDNKIHDGPKIMFDEQSINLGKISKSDGVTTTTFKVKNIGKETLKIDDISTSCGCTTAEISEKTILQNQEAVLTVHFDPNFHDEPLGKFTRTVFIETNDPSLPEAEINIVIEEVVE
ncbi:MAG: DUF1573 domain-containing protein [Nanoarchaeota archaeon]|nr:DUF1573 domain-containing protein [Nanoarchaeota archaeon]